MPEPHDKIPSSGYAPKMNGKNLEVKCDKCGWVHVAIPLETAHECADSVEELSRYYRCFFCGAPSRDFVPAGEDDAPMGCTLQAIVIESKTQPLPEAEAEELRVWQEIAAKRRAALDQILELVSSEMEREAEQAHLELEAQGRRWVATAKATNPKHLH
jgi:rubredoxin